MKITTNEIPAPGGVTAKQMPYDYLAKIIYPKTHVRYGQIVLAVAEGIVFLDKQACFRAYTDPSLENLRFEVLSPQSTVTLNNES